MAKKHSRVITELERLDHIKRLVVVAMFSDQDLIHRFVLKGGNAIDLVLEVGTRASLDVDLSMETDFAPAELEDIRQRLEKGLQEVFAPEGYLVFGVILEEKPPSVSPEVATFWGGYSVTFKLIETAQYQACQGDLLAMRRNAVLFGAKGKFEIDISKFEYCGNKQAALMNGRPIFAYTAEMLICEKLRAICQQMPEYGPVVKRSRPGTARARDFVDIQLLIERFSIEMTSPHNLELLRLIFDAKRVPLSLLAKVTDFRDFHGADFQAVRDSVKPGITIHDFEFYFDFVTGLCTRLLKALGNE